MCIKFKEKEKKMHIYFETIYPSGSHTIDRKIPIQVWFNSANMLASITYKRDDKKSCSSDSFLSLVGGFLALGNALSNSGLFIKLYFKYALCSASFLNPINPARE